jgi:2-polyprenyl-3-methyl-5-hydroxy-6-metoxy-1,4-benzoquinol methylase
MTESKYADEKKAQENFEWSRENQYASYGKFLGFYQVKAVLENCKNRSSLLDLACGDGYLTEMLSSHFQHVVGVDASSVHLSKAKSRLPNVSFHESLIEELDINERFECITMLNILEHVEDPVNVLKKVAGYLNDDGVLVIHVPNSKAVNREIAVLMGTLTSVDELSPFDVNIGGHRRYYDMDSLKKDVTDAGLKIAKMGGVFYKMLSGPQMDWFLEKGLWDSGFGWGRVGGEQKDWRKEFCDACYEFGKERPEDCNIIFAVVRTC